MSVPPSGLIITIMKASDNFTNIISTHLQNLAEKDSLFAETLTKPGKNITDCITYIFNTVKNSGCSGFADEEIYGMAVHYYDEDDIKVATLPKGKVVINRSAGPDKKTQRADVKPPLAKSVEKVKKVAEKKQMIDNQASLF